MAQLGLKIGDKTYNKAWVDNVSSTSQISSDAGSVNYGVIASTGSAKMRDINGQIRADIENGVLPISNAPTKVIINGNQIQEHITSDSDYNIIDKELDLQFSDRLSLLDKVTYGGMPLREYSMTAYEMLDDVIGSYGGYCRERVINWTKYQHEDAITTSISNNGISVKTGDGWEIIGTSIRVTPNVQHTVRFSIKNIKEYVSDSGIAVQVLSSAPTDTDCSTISLASANLPKTADTTMLGNMQFSSNTDTVYFVLNFGFANDAQDITVEISSITIDNKSLSRSTQNECFSGVFSSAIPPYFVITTTTVKNVLSNKKIDYPYLPSATYRETIEKFCALGQLTMALDENGEIQFYGARPRYANETIRNIPNSYKISNLNRTLFLKNKIDGVDIKQDKVKDEVVVATNIYNWDSSLDEFSKNTDTATATDVEISITYYNGQITIPKKSNDNLEKMLRISDFKFSCSGIHSSGTVEKIWFDGGSSYKFNYTSRQEETWQIETFSVSNKSGSQTATLNNNFSLLVTQNDDEYTITFSIPVSENYWYWEMYAGNTYSDLQDYKATKLEVSLYGDKRVVSFEEVDASSANIENATTTVSVPTNELMQARRAVDTIRDNIIEDYANGVPTATIDLFCGLGDWNNGEVIKPNEIVTFDGDVDKNGIKNLWRVTGRTFKYNGAPILGLELQRQKAWNKIWSWTGSVKKDNIWNESGQGYYSGQIDLPIKVNDVRNTFIVADIVYVINGRERYDTITGFRSASGRKLLTGTTQYVNCNLSISDDGTKIGYYADYVSKKVGLTTYVGYVKSIEVTQLITAKYY